MCFSAASCFSRVVARRWGRNSRRSRAFQPERVTPQPATAGLAPSSRRRLRLAFFSQPQQNFSSSASFSWREPSHSERIRALSFHQKRPR
jgi:hypothetical protein